MELPVFLFDSPEVEISAPFAAPGEYTDADSIKCKEVFDTDGCLGQETGIDGLSVGMGAVAHDCFLGFRPGQGGLVVAL